MSRILVMIACGQVIDEDGRDRTPKPLLGAHSSSVQEEPDAARVLHTARGDASFICPVLIVNE